MKKDWNLTQESFDALLYWLDPVRDEAGRKYEHIRRSLIKIFTCRGCPEAEDLADETINRVSTRLKEIEADYEGDRARYFYGVANKVHLESFRSKKPLPAPVPAEDSNEKEIQSHCLEKCIQKLTQDNRTLVLSYYRDEKGSKIAHRKELADQLGIAINALRIRAHRIRSSLYNCVRNCVLELKA